MRYSDVRSKWRMLMTLLADFKRRKRLKRLVEQFGTFDAFQTQEELMRLREGE